MSATQPRSTRTRAGTVLAAIKIVGLSLLLAGMVGAPPPPPEPAASPPEPTETRFMARFIDRVNPGLSVEDPVCAEELPRAIYRYARRHSLDWQRLFVLAWQESSFDCHAKNRRDLGGAYGPFQIRRVWEPVVGDPRANYFDPERAVERVVQIIEYYQDTERFQELTDRRFRHPLLCLYNTGETRRVNMRYCRQVGRKMRLVQQAWIEFLARAASA